MKNILFAIGILALGCNACNDVNTTEESAIENTKAPNIIQQELTYPMDSAMAKGFLIYDESREGAGPGIVVVHEWWGINDYVIRRGHQLAELGYTVLVADMYGSGKTGANPEEATQLSTPFYKDPELAKTRLAAAINKLKSFSQTDTTKIAAIGYCFGGFIVLNGAKQGLDLDGVVSFHGNLSGVAAKQGLLKSKILVCHGAADQFVSEEELSRFKANMNEVGADYTIKIYPDATHAFTNPDATATGEKFGIPIKYNAAADTASWSDMKEFFNRIF